MATARTVGPSTGLTTRRRLAALIAAGTVVRLILAVTTKGQGYDMNSLEIVRQTLADYGLHVYSHVNEGSLHWPYGSGFFPFAALAGEIAGDSTTAFRALVRLPAIAADAALAWVVQDYLRGRGANDNTRLGAAAVVALGPVFVGISGFHGQIDSLAILPAALALLVWERMDGERRALFAGALIGAGGAIKTVPLLMVLALAPTSRSWRELAGLAVAAAAIPLIVIAPFLVTTPDDVTRVVRGYHGYPGQGGLSLALQPNLGLPWLMGLGKAPVHYSQLTQHLFFHASLAINVVVIATAAFLARYRPSPAVAASVLWLAVLAFAPGFFFQYLIWGLPFFLMAGYVRSAGLLQLAVLAPMLLYYLAPWSTRGPAYVFISIQLVVWAGMLAALVVVARGAVTGRPPADLLPRWGRTPLIAGRSSDPSITARSLPRLLPESLSARALRRLGLATFGAGAVFSLVPLAMLIRYANVHGVVFSGMDGPFPADQFQYLSWIRQFGEGLLVANQFDIAPSSRVFLHPMFLPSGLLDRAGVSTPVAYLLWKPVAVIALFAGFRAYVARFLGTGWERFAALVIALFCAVPVAALMDWGSIGSSSEFFPSVARVTAELFPAELSWGYLPTVIAVGLMPVFLLGAERLVRPAGEGPERRWRYTALVAACGVTISWLHPWQGEIVLATVVAAIALGRFDRRYLALAVPVAAAAAPLAYYVVLSRTDSAWELAQQANAVSGLEGGHIPIGAVVLTLAPILLPALWGVRARVEDFGERMLLLWPIAAALVFLFLSPSFPQHAFEGLSLPLAILAVRGLARLERPLAWTLAFAVAITVPGTVWGVTTMRDNINSGLQPFFLEPAEDDALDYLAAAPEPGGVLPTHYLGSLVPERTGRQTWVGHVSWTPDFQSRVRDTEALFHGTLPRARAVDLVRSSGAAFVLGDCKHRADLLPALDRIVVSVRRFGCTSVYRIRSPQ